MTIRLIAEDGPLAGQIFELRPGSHDVGRHGAEVSILQDRYLDDQHAVIEVDERDASVRDLGSAHGTFLNGHRVTAAPLCDGDVVQFGTTRLRVTADQPAGHLRCPGCGTGLGAVPPPVCPRCGRDLAPLVRGDVTGEAATAFCVACGRRLPPSSRFCPGCGHDAQQLPPPAIPVAQRHAAPTWMLATMGVLIILLALAMTWGGIAYGRMSAAERSAAQLTAPAPTPAAPAAPAAPAPESPALPSYGGGSASANNWRQTGRVLLRYGGQPGQRRRYDATTKMTGTIKAMTETMPLDIDATSSYGEEVLQNDGTRLVTRLTLSPWGALQNGQAFRGALPPAPAPMTVVMLPTGEIERVEAAGNWESAAPQGLPNGLMFDYQTILQNLSGMSFPERELQVGDTWNRTATVPLPNGGHVVLQSESRLDGFTRFAERDVARIITRLTAPITMTISGADRQPVNTVGELSGPLTSLFDPDEGALVRSDSEMNLRLTMTGSTAAAGAGQVPGVGDINQMLQGLQGLYSLGDEEGGGGGGRAPATPTMPNLGQAVTLEATGTVRSAVVRTE